MDYDRYIRSSSIDGQGNKKANGSVDSGYQAVPGMR
jgi:hypothetical protein